MSERRISNSGIQLVVRWNDENLRIQSHEIDPSEDGLGLSSKHAVA